MAHWAHIEDKDFIHFSDIKSPFYRRVGVRGSFQNLIQSVRVLLASDAAGREVEDLL